MYIPAAADETADLAREKHSLARQGTSTCVKNIAYLIKIGKPVLHE
jgi:hypothetical protein